MAKVLLFQCENEREIRQILTPMKIQAVSVPKTKFHMTLKELERENDDEGYFGGTYPEGSMIVMCDFTEKAAGSASDGFSQSQRKNRL